MYLSLKRIQLCVVSCLLIIESIGILLWVNWPQVLLPWPVDRGLVNYGYCKAINESIIGHITIQVNPWTHLFAGIIARMINSYIAYHTPSIVNFADHCGNQVNLLAGDDTIDYDDPSSLSHLTSILIIKVFLIVSR